MDFTILSLTEIIFYLGLSLTLGYSLSFLLEKYGIPNVVIYLIIGFIISNIFLTELYGTHEFDFWFHLMETITLGLIGFKIGIEMEMKLLKKHSKVITILVLFEVLGAFIVVFILTYVFTQIFILSLILAGLATATAPAATIEVIRRLKAKGPLTRNLKWVLAFDDVVAVVIVEGILSYLIIQNLGEQLTILNYLVEIGRELGLAVIVGLAFGYILDLFVENREKKNEILELTFAFLILVMGVARFIETSVILSCMVVGMVTVNRAGNNYEKAEDYLDIIMSPILIIFFLFVGAQIHWSDFIDPFPALAFVYFIARSIGKIGGVFLSGNLSGADPVIKSNLGLGLLPQGGVALGLMAVANDILVEAGMADIGALLVVTIVISTVFSEGVGAIGARFALGRAGEINMDIK